MVATVKVVVEAVSVPFGVIVMGENVQAEYTGRPEQLKLIC